MFGRQIAWIDVADRDVVGVGPDLDACLVMKADPAKHLVREFFIIGVVQEESCWEFDHSPSLPGLWLRDF